MASRDFIFAGPSPSQSLFCPICQDIFQRPVITRCVAAQPSLVVQSRRLFAANLFFFFAVAESAVTHIANRVYPKQCNAIHHARYVGTVPFTVFPSLQIRENNSKLGITVNLFLALARRLTSKTRYQTWFLNPSLARFLLRTALSTVST
jgi:hypothetical protein